MLGTNEVSLSTRLLLDATNNRHGLVFRPKTARLSKSDVSDVFHVGVPSSITDQWRSASGGVGWDERTAQLAAIGEGVERYCAALIQVPLQSRDRIAEQQRLDPERWALFSLEQRGRRDFPFGNLYSLTCQYTNVYSCVTNDEYWVPHPLVVLRDDYATGIPTSSGLAAGSTSAHAALRAIQELIERDALMITWLHSIAARAIALAESLSAEVHRLQGEVYAFDLTPDYSPFPVIAVAGGIPSRGQWRFSLGVACRETFEQAQQKAFLEWCQGVFFAGVYPKYVDIGQLTRPEQVNSFDDHAIYYTRNPEQWAQLPMFANKNKIHSVRIEGTNLDPHMALQMAVSTLTRHGVRLFYRDLTTIDGLQAGVRVVRALSPNLVPINSHHAWPFLGNDAQNVSLRYEWAAANQVPNPFPHPLG